ncbi:MAG: hypothetical protein PsegKO_29710 [Pseudohongiellaceae bacterium]|jgi:predicted transcriptional regulator
MLPPSKSRRSHSALPNALGEVELKVMEWVWASPGTDARAITSELNSVAPCRLSTVQAALERLVRKDYLRREKHGHAYRYFARQSRSELLGTMLKDVIRLLHDGQANTILSSFVNAAERLNDEALDELETLIHRKRRDREQNHD